MDNNILNSTKKKLNNNLPKHLAIIMDGNGRWAKKQKFSRDIGHKNGAFTVKKITEECVKTGIKYLTLYAFSTENWNRPKLEVSLLMKLFKFWMKKEQPTLIHNNIKFNVIGNLNNLPNSVKVLILDTIEKTKNNNTMTFSLAISYSSRNEITNAVKQISTKVQKNQISIEKIDENTISNHLFTKNLPDVDLLIRTSGEQRISNFLLWQLSYAELYFCEKLWPDFEIEDLHLALREYKNRDRRFGKI